MIPEQIGFYVTSSKYPELQSQEGVIFLFELGAHKSQLLNPLLHEFV